MLLTKFNKLFTCILILWVTINSNSIPFFLNLNKILSFYKSQVIDVELHNAYNSNKANNSELPYNEKSQDQMNANADIYQLLGENQEFEELPFEDEDLRKELYSYETYKINSNRLESYYSKGFHPILYTTSIWKPPQNSLSLS